jgi:hypothetical protein
VYIHRHIEGPAGLSCWFQESSRQDLAEVAHIAGFETEFNFLDVHTLSHVPWYAVTARHVPTSDKVDYSQSRHDTLKQRRLARS